MQLVYPFFANHLALLMAGLVPHAQPVVISNSFDDTVRLYMVDRRRLEYRFLNRRFRVLLPYSVAYVVLLYGMDKIIDVQFPGLELSRLVRLMAAPRRWG